MQLGPIETTDLDLVVRTFKAREPDVPLYAIGFSLGGNVLLKWLGETGATSAIRAAATLSVPYDLEAASRYLERRVGRIYTYHFMRRLKTKALDLIGRFPRETAHIDAARVRAAQTFFEFDDSLTAPLHGFAGADAYYAQSSAVGFLTRVAIPTYCLNAVDDPFYPPESVARAAVVAASNAQLRFEVTKWGGHTGFVSGRWPWRPHYWAEEATLDWLTSAARG